MQPARIAELLTPFLDPANRLPSDVLQSISMYIDILLRWNARMNLTAIRDPEQIVTRHFGESFFAARHLFPIASVSSVAKAPRVADVGSGAGFPGLPFKLWCPGMVLTLIESNHKKAAFLSEVARALTLTDVIVQTARAETLAPFGFDVVTLRAVERFEAVLPAASGLVARPGRLALLIGSSQLLQAKSLLGSPDLELPPPCWSEATPIPLSQSRVLITATYQ